MSLDSDVDSLALTSKNEMGQPVLFTVNGLKLSGNTHLSPEGVRIGDQSVDIEKVNASINGQDALTLHKMKGTSSSITAPVRLAAISTTKLKAFSCRSRILVRQR